MTEQGMDCSMKSSTLSRKRTQLKATAYYRGRTPDRREGVREGVYGKVLCYILTGASQWTEPLDRKVRLLQASCIVSPCFTLLRNGNSERIVNE